MFSAQPACPAAQEVALQQGPPPFLVYPPQKGASSPHFPLLSSPLTLVCPCNEDLTAIPLTPFPVLFTRTHHF